MKNSSAQVAGEVAALRARIDAWRDQKKRGEAMPDGLWESAAELATVHGIGTISRALGVHYGRLMRLVDALEQRESEPPIEFVELPRLTSPVASATGTPTVVEMTRANGSSVRVELPNGTVDILALASRFWGGDPCSR